MSYQPEDFRAWDIFEVIDREHEPACYELFREQGFCAGIEPYSGAIEGVERLHALTEVHVVSSPIHGPYWYYERAEWVRKHLRIQPGDVHQTRHKQDVFGHYLLDDRPKHIEEWAHHHPYGLALLWDQPYNRGEDAAMISAPNMRRVCSWDEVVQQVTTSLELMQIRMQTEALIRHRLAHPSNPYASGSG